MGQEKPEKIYQSQQGVVSLIVVSILTVTLALIAIGFSKLSDRELRQASNRELASQAYYAAQSGINDAIAYINAGGGGFPGCDWPHGGLADNYFTKDLSNGSNIAKYSCISVDSTQQILKNDNVVPGQPWIVKIDAKSLDKLYIGWENKTYDKSKDPEWLSPYTLPQDSYYTDPDHPNRTGVLRVGMYEVPRGVPSDNVTLARNSITHYLYPKGGSGVSGGNYAYSAGQYCVVTVPGCAGPKLPNGNFVDGDCNINRYDVSGNGLNENTYCNVKVTALNGDDNDYYLYFTAQYVPLKVVIQGKAAGPGKITFTGAQTVIDVTGQAADQIQRVRARVGLTPQFNTPSYAVQSMESLCKAFVMQINPGKTYKTADGPGSAFDPTGCVTPSPGISDSIGPPVPGELSGH